MQHQNGKVSVDSNNVNGIRKLSSRQVQQMIWFPFNLPIKKWLHRTTREGARYVQNGFLYTLFNMDFSYFVQNEYLFYFCAKLIFDLILYEYRADETKVRVPHIEQQPPNSRRDIFNSCSKVLKMDFWKSSPHSTTSPPAVEPAFLTSLKSFNHLLTPLTGWEGW